MSADSIAYFEYNIPGYLERNGKDQTRKKIRFMYVRLHHEAKKIIEQMKFQNPQIATLVKEALAGEIKS